LNALCAFILALSLVVSAGSLLALISRRLRRRAALVLGASVVTFVVSVGLFKPDKPPEVAVTPQVEAVTPQVQTVARPVLTPHSVVPALPAKDEPLPWRYEIKEGFKFPAQFLTLTAVSLRNSNPCAEAKVQMLTGAVGTKTMKRASDNHIFVIGNVLDYPIPTEGPPIEIGKLIDDISVEAMLTTDVLKR
jgi:hypothetical protein